MSKYNRSNFYKDITLKNSIRENDLLTNTFNQFKTTRPVTFYTIIDDDLLRPDLLSLKIYGSQDYWWLLLKFNDIEDPYNDLKVGDVLKIPNLNDIEDYYLENRNKNK